VQSAHPVHLSNFTLVVRLDFDPSLGVHFQLRQKLGEVLQGGAPLAAAYQQLVPRPPVAAEGAVIDAQSVSQLPHRIDQLRYTLCIPSPPAMHPWPKLSEQGSSSKRP